MCVIDIRKVSDLRLLLDILRSIAANPRIHLQLIPHLPTQQLVDGHIQLPRLEIPQRNINARQGAHEHRASTVEARPPRHLPNMFNLAGQLFISLIYHVAEEKKTDEIR